MFYYSTFRKWKLTIYHLWFYGWSDTVFWSRMREASQKFIPFFFLVCHNVQQLSISHTDHVEIMQGLDEVTVFSSGCKNVFFVVCHGVINPFLVNVVVFHCVAFVVRCNKCKYFRIMLFDISFTLIFRFRKWFTKVPNAGVIFTCNIKETESKYNNGKKLCQGKFVHIFYWKFIVLHMVRITYTSWVPEEKKTPWSIISIQSGSLEYPFNYKSYKIHTSAKMWIHLTGPQWIQPRKTKIITIQWNWVVINFSKFSKRLLATKLMIISNEKISTTEKHLNLKTDYVFCRHLI